MDTLSAPPTSPAPARSRGPLLLGLGLVLLTLLVYRDAPSFEFVNFDDGLYVTGNQQVQKGLTWDGFLWAWQANVASNWHPLTMLSHMLDCELYGLNPRGHHLTNLLLHLANVWLLFEVLRRMTGRAGPSAFVAALFGVHPTHVESVAWIAERKDVLSGLFFLLTLAAYHRWVRDRTPRRYALVAVLFACGLLSKPMLVTLPCVLLLLDVWPLGRLRFEEIRSVRQLWQGLRPLLVEKIPLFVLSMASSAVTVYAQQGSLATLEAVSPVRRVSNALVSYVSYLAKSFWPEKLAAFYPLPGAVPLDKALVAGALLLAITALVVWRLRRAPWLAVGWFWFLGMLVPVIGLVQVGRQAMADRYTYLPSIGLFLAIAWGVTELLGAKTRMRRAALAGAALAVVGALSITAHAQAATWKDSLTLFRHALAVTKNNYLAHLNVAVALSAQGDQQGALHHYHEVLRIQPNLAEAHAALGTALRRWGRTAEALPYLRRAVRMKPERARLRHTLAVALEDLGRKDEAMVELRKAIELSPRLADAHYGLGALLQEQGKVDEALEHYRIALEINPDLNDLYAPTATLLARRGELGEALRHYQEAVRRQPTPSAHFNLALTLERMGRIEEARRQYKQALVLDPGLEPARQRLGALQ
jgi:tetratricopeptide (TPR) repeat protein